MENIDELYLRELDQLQGPDESDLVQELIDLFFAAAPDRLTGIRSALAGGDFERVRKEAHGFRSTCYNVGARHLASACERLENRVRSGDLAGLRAEREALSAEIEDEFRHAARDLRIISEKRARLRAAA